MFDRNLAIDILHQTQKGIAPVFMKTNHSVGFQAVTDFPAYRIRSKTISAVIPQIQSPEWRYTSIRENPPSQGRW